MYDRPMELRQLEAFSVLAEERHFGRAALRLHLSQPALTYQIQRLEEELGLGLLTRTTRKVELTPAGHALRDGARLLLEDTGVLVDRVRRIGRGEVGIVRIGCVASALHGLIPSVVREAREQYPDVQFILAEKKTGDQLLDLLSGRLDLGLVHKPATVPPGIELVDLFTQPVGIALPDNHPASGRAAVPLADLAGTSFVLFPRALEPDTYDLFVQACVSAGFAPAVTQEAENIQTLLALVAAGMGCAFVPQSVMDGSPRPGVVFRPLLPPPAITSAIAWPTERSNPAADEFRRIVLDASAKMHGGDPSKTPRLTRPPVRRRAAG